MKKPEQIKKEKIILVIDSNKIHQYLLDRIFVRSNYDLVLAGNKHEIYDNFKLIKKFDLVLIEPLLCDTNGFELIKLIKELRNDIPIIVLTVCVLSNEREKCFEYGCDAFISKPFSAKNLLHTIEQTLKLKYVNGC